MENQPIRSRLAKLAKAQRRIKLESIDEQLGIRQQ
jgi:hypothetical protein